MTKGKFFLIVLAVIVISSGTYDEAFGSENLRDKAGGRGYYQAAAG